MSKLPILTRRTFCGGVAAAAGLPLISTKSAWAQATYPSRAFRVMIPTGQGGGAERLARSFDGPWSKLLNNQPFEYEFQAGAAGQVGYTLFVQKRDHDGYNLLFGNMGPEMIMYATQKPDYKFPDDFIYFCRTDIDDSCVFVRKDSSYKDIKAVVEAAKKKPLNVALSRIPHPATIGMLALGETTGAKFNFIPYGGGNPTYTALLSGEADVGALPITGVLSLKDKFRVLTVFNDKNIFACDRQCSAGQRCLRQQYPRAVLFALLGRACQMGGFQSQRVWLAGKDSQGSHLVSGIQGGLHQDRRPA
jgi:tripartite-type tricarboxylate transporter receptor subunit TctC